MKKKRIQHVEEEGSIDLIERAVHLLRQTPAVELALFYIGAIPFVMGLLFYLADMAASPFAPDRCAGSAFGVALLYIWMKCWHAAFCRRLYDRAGRRNSAALNGHTLLKSIYFQLTQSSWGMLVLPIAALIMIPFGWVYAYYQNLCIVDIANLSAEEANLQARKNSKPWPKQNHYVITILYGFGYLVFLNIVTVMSQLPSLLKSLLGIETVFSLSYHWMGNTTFLAAVAALTYLVVEPFVKSAYVLRYYACESITTGEDLLADLKQIPKRRRGASGLVQVILISVLSIGAMGVKAEDSAQRDLSSIQVETLDETVDRVMQKKEFTWRMPREYAQEEEDKGFFGEFLDSVQESVERFMKKMGESIERFFEWLGDQFTKSEKQKPKTGGFDPAFFKGLSIFVLIIFAMVLVILLAKAILARNRPAQQIREAKSAPIQVDLEDEHVIATMLEEDEWIAMARELAEQGELRKAMRAWFLAGLAALSRLDLLSILQSKSNQDYRKELNRRARCKPELLPVFSDNIRLFEQGWYGLHVVTLEELQQLEENLERMRHGSEA